MGSIFARPKRAKTNSARNPAPDCRTYSGQGARVKKKLVKMALNPSEFGHFCTSGPVLPGPKGRDETNRFHLRCPGNSGYRQGAKWLRKLYRPRASLRMVPAVFR